MRIPVLLPALFFFLFFSNAEAQFFKAIQKVNVSQPERLSRNSCGRMPGDNFGYSLDTDSGRMFSGAYLRDMDTSKPLYNNTGAAYIYERINNAWVMKSRLTAPFPKADDRFGQVLSVKGNWLFIASSYQDFDADESDSIADAGAVYVYRLERSVWVFKQKIVSPDRTAGDRFGYSVDAGLKYAAIGLPFEDEDSSGNNTLNNAGSVYVYRLYNDSWYLDKKIHAGIRRATDNFGFAVSLSDSTLAVGSTNNNTNASNTSSINGAGSVYIFKRVNGYWTQVQKIVPSDRSIYDYFGTSLSLDSNQLAIGSMKNNSTGRAYIFKDSANQYREKYKISSKDIEATDMFGHSVFLKKGWLVVGAPEEDHDTIGINQMGSSGSAYVFKEKGNSWVQVKKLVGLRRNNTQNQGWAVAITDSFVLTGAYGSFFNDKGKEEITTGGGGPGAVHYYPRNNLNTIYSIVQNDYAPYNRFAYSLALQSRIAAVGAIGEDKDSNGMNAVYNAGAVYVYGKNGREWSCIQKLQASDRKAFDEFGNSVAVSGEYIFAGASKSSLDVNAKDSAFTAGAVYVYKWSGTRYEQVQKLLAFDRRERDWFGYEVKASDSILAVSCPFSSKDTNGMTWVTNAGAVYIFRLDSGKWKYSQKIIAKDAGINDFYSSSISLRDNNLIVGAMYSSLDSAGKNKVNYAGSAYVYRNVNRKFYFVQKLCADQRISSAYFGNAVDIQGDLAFVGALTDRRIQNITGTGSVYIYRWQNGRYQQVKRLNANVIGENYQFGENLVYRDSLLFIFAIREHQKIGNDSFPEAGVVYCYKDSGNNNWKLIRKFGNEDAFTQDGFGYSMALDSGHLWIGAPNQDAGIKEQTTLRDAGAAYVFHYGNCITDTVFLQASACVSYLSPSATQTWTKTGRYYDYIEGKGVCDSLFAIDLTIGVLLTDTNIVSCTDMLALSGKHLWDTTKLYYDTLQSWAKCDSIIRVHFTRIFPSYYDTTIFSCSTVLSPSGKMLDVSGVYQDTIVNRVNCDSVITLRFTRYYSTKYDTSVTSCYPFLTAGGKLLSISGVYTDTIKNYHGCDSFINYNFTKLNQGLSDTTIKSCNGFISIKGKWYTQSGVYMDTLVAYNGCDSIVTSKFTKLDPSDTVLLMRSCSSALTPLGKLMDSTGIYTDSLINSLGCDSLVHIHFTAFKSSMRQFALTSCKQYIHPLNQKIYTSSATLTDTLKSYGGCDSIVVTNLSIAINNFGIYLKNDTLFSNTAIGHINWLRCDSMYTPVLDTNKFYKPKINGFYLAELVRGNCRDTSDCILYASSAIKNSIAERIRIFPNPAEGSISIRSEASGTYTIYSVTGLALLSGKLNGALTQVDISIYPAGIFILELKQNSEIIYLKLMKH